MTTSELNRGLTRRQFLGTAGLGASSLMLGLGGIGQALAAGRVSTSGYRALVCVYLFGGNDGFNTVVPTGAAGYAQYAASRRNLALPQNSLLPLNGVARDGNAYGLHASCPEMQGHFNAGRLAIIGNVGTLVQPTSVAQARAGQVRLPSHLFSHVDQQAQWWTSLPDDARRLGWAGRISDLYFQEGYRARLAMNINISVANYWGDGRTTAPYTLGTGGAPRTHALTSTSYRQGRRMQAALDMLNQGAADPHLLVQEFTAVQNNSREKVSLVEQALNSAGQLTTTFPTYVGDSGLGGQLRQVARCIKAQSQIGDARQMFFVSINGFDTHNTQLAEQSRLLAIVSKNLDTFWKAMNEIGQQNNVTTFTASDFGRGLTSNGDGADHAWASHHFAMGGAVRGGYYGQMPSLALDGPSDFGAGRIIPTTSTDQYAGTLANWFGVADSALNGIFPNLPNFSTRNLGFMA